MVVFAFIAFATVALSQKVVEVGFTMDLNDRRVAGHDSSAPYPAYRSEFHCFFYPPGSDVPSRVTGAYGSYGFFEGALVGKTATIKFIETTAAMVPQIGNITITYDDTFTSANGTFQDATLWRSAKGTVNPYPFPAAKCLWSLSDFAPALPKFNVTATGYGVGEEIRTR